MKKKFYMFLVALVFSGLFVGCNKKDVQPEPIPTNEVTEVIETNTNTLGN
jgi:hypothetical protein